MAREAEATRLEDVLRLLLENKRLEKNRRFASSSEKSEYLPINLFDEVEVTADGSAEPALEKVQAHYRKKASEKKDRLPSDLEVEVVEYVLEGEEKRCPQCESELDVIGKTVRERLKLIPAKAVLFREIQYTYACKACEKTACSTPVIKAPMPPSLISGSLATAETVAQIMVQKFVMASPLYRQEQEWERQGILLSRQTMSNWLIKCCECYLKPIYEALHRELLQREVLHADETPIQILCEEGKSPQSKSYMWLYRSGKTDARVR